MTSAGCTSIGARAKGARENGRRNEAATKKREEPESVEKLERGGKRSLENKPLTFRAI
jgi:hypothetical protein